MIIPTEKALIAVDVIRERISKAGVFLSFRDLLINGRSCSNHCKLNEVVSQGYYTQNQVC